MAVQAYTFHLPEDLYERLYRVAALRGSGLFRSKDKHGNWKPGYEAVDTAVTVAITEWLDRQGQAPQAKTQS